ncbi:MAG: phage tail tape measure protein [Bacteroidales bacterium]|jgi:TP901 family phage tail tape measure protein|nr:phage tail tape measure protein [Bacteroidales bacterium]
MSIHEEAKASVYLDGKQAENELENLRTKSDRLEKKMAEMRENNDLAGFKKLEKELKATKKQMRALNLNVFDLDRVLNNLSGASIDELTKAKRKLNRQIRKAGRNTTEYAKKSEQLSKVKAELKLLNTEYKKNTSLAQRMTNSFNKYWGVLAVGIASLTGVVLSFKKAIGIFNNFEERVSNLSALTGLTGKKLDWLSNKAKETSVATIEGNIRIKQSADAIVDAYTKVGSKRPELLKNKEALHSVTQEAIILSEAAKTQLDPAVGGLTMAMNQFDIGAEDTRKTINVLAAGSKAGAADIPYLTDAMEKSGTTAHMMGIKLEGWTGVIETIAPFYQEASQAGNSFDKVLLKMKEKNIGYKNGVFDMNRALEELNIKFKNGQSASSIFGVEHSKMAQLLVDNRSKIKSFENAVTGTNTAIEQASINTNNNAGKLAQAKNRFSLVAMELGEKLAPSFTFSTNAASYLIKATVELIKWFAEYKEIIIPVVTAITSYVVITKLQTMWTTRFGTATLISTIKLKAQTIALKGARAAGILFAATKALLTGNIKRATAAMRLFNMVSKMNPYVLIISLIVAAGAALVMYINKVNSVTRAQKELNAIELEAKKAIIDKKLKMEELIRTAKNQSLSLEKRKEAIKKLNNLAPDYLGNLTLEKINTDKAKKSIDEYILSLEKAARVKAARDKLSEIDGELLDLHLSNKGAELGFWDVVEASITNFGSVGGIGLKAVEKYNEKEKELIETKKALIKLIDEQTHSENKLQESGGSGGGGGFNGIEDELAKLEQLNKARILQIKKQYLNELLTKKEHSEALLAQDILYLTKKLELYKAKGEDVYDIEKQLTDKSIALMEKRKDAEKLINKLIADFNNGLKKDEENFKVDDLDIDYEEDVKLGEDLDKKNKEDSVNLAVNGLFSTEQARFDYLKTLRENDVINEEEYQQALIAIQRRTAEERKAINDASFQSIGNMLEALNNMYEGQMNAELNAAGDNEEKKDEIRKKYARKQQQVAIGQAFIAGSMAIMRIWQGHITNNPVVDKVIKAALSISQAALTASQIQRIKSQQFKSGGYLEVIGEDDNKTYNSEYRGIQRGYFSRPTLLVSESGGEFVASNKAVNNPTIKPVLDVINMAQKTGTVGSLNLPKAISTISSKAYKDGGYSEQSVTSDNYQFSNSDIDIHSITEALERNNILIDKLMKKLDQPLKTELPLYGRNSLSERQAEADYIINGIDK